MDINGNIFQIRFVLCIETEMLLYKKKRKRKSTGEQQYFLLWTY